MIYTMRGTDREEWADRVLADKETSAIEAHIGTFLEEVARIGSLLVMSRVGRQLCGTVVPAARSFRTSDRRWVMQSTPRPRDRARLAPATSLDLAQAERRGLLPRPDPAEPTWASR